MNKLLLISFLMFCCYGCSDNKLKGNTINDKDLSIETKTEQQKSNTDYGSGIIDLTTNKKIDEVLCQGWEMADDIEAINNAGENDESYPFRSFYLSPDHSFVKNPRNEIEYGNWEYNDLLKTITLKNGDGTEDIYKIAALSPHELQVINVGIKSQTVLKFFAAGMRHGKITDDPYYIYNNLWRIKPFHDEPDTVIKKRLKDCLHFFILFYRDAIVKNTRVISFYGLPVCLKWYNGGIFMVKREELNKKWINCFYNEKEAMKAYDMMAGIMNKKYTWPKGNIGWVKKNLAILGQMYKYLDKN